MHKGSPPDDIIDGVEAEPKALQVFLFRVTEGPAAAIRLIDEQAFKGWGLEHRGGYQAWKEADTRTSLRPVNLSYTPHGYECQDRVQMAVGELTDDVATGKDLRGSQDVGVDQSLINPEEGLVPTSSDPRGLTPIFGSNVRHWGGLGVPVWHV